METTSTEDIELISFPIFMEQTEQGILRSFEMSLMPFDVKRIFTVRADAGGLRGQHAHRECAQLLVCISGQVSVLCNDSRHEVNYTLRPQSDALLLPPGIWSHQAYDFDSSSLLVFCDYPFDEADYIRDYGVFLNLKLGRCE